MNTILTHFKHCIKKYALLVWNLIIAILIHVEHCIKKYAVLSGRATRAEYWSFFFINSLIELVLFVTSFQDIFNQNMSLLYVTNIYHAFVFAPLVAVTVRRFHDTNRSAWHFFIPMLLAPILFIALLLNPIQLPNMGLLPFIIIISIFVIAMIYIVVVLALKSAPEHNTYNTKTGHPVISGIILVTIAMINYILPFFFMQQAQNADVPVLPLDESAQEIKLTDEEQAQFNKMIKQALEKSATEDVVEIKP